MPLSIVATPIGNPKDLTLRAQEVLKSCTHIIVEDRKVGSQFLKAWYITGKKLELLNEHSSPEEIEELVELCQSHEVGLISDGGTPGFADPGPALVRLCRHRRISITPIPGASCLMTILSLSSERIDQFLYRGFLPQQTDLRRQEWIRLAKENQALILMDTPYRLEKTLDELIDHFPHRRLLLGLNLTHKEQVEGNELILEGTPSEIRPLVPYKKAEFLVLIYPFS